MRDGERGGWELGPVESAAAAKARGYDAGYEASVEEGRSVVGTLE